MEKIQAMDVSEEEKQRLIDDMAFYQGMHAKPTPRLSDKEILRIIIEDNKAEQQPN